jgi:hypothetical protein
MQPATSPDNPLVANVQYGYQLGWSFTPLSGKKPTLGGWQKRPRETLDEALGWAARQNVGLRTGAASGVVVIDKDPEGDISGLDLPGTVTANTGRPGAIHLYLRCSQPIGNSVGKLAPHIDVRGDGGQVVFPGSVHPDTGRRYEWAEGLEPWTVEMAELPQHIIDRLNARDAPDRPSKPSPAPPGQAKARRYAAVALKLEVAAVCAAQDGTRNSTLNKAAFNLGTLVASGYLDRETVESQLRQAAESVGLGRQETAATIRSGMESGLEHPRRVEIRSTAGQDVPAPRPRRDYILTPGPHKDDQGRYTEQSVLDFAQAVLAELPEEAIYRKDFIPGEILGECGRRQWVEFSENRMRIVVDGHVKLGKWVTSRKTGEQVMVYQACGKDAAGVVIAHARQAPSVRELTLMVGYPVYGPGFVRVQPGWHDGLYYDEPEELRGIEPEVDCEVIHNVLHDLVVDFPFKSDSDRQNFFGLMLTPIVAPAIDGNRPMHLLHSPLERTGKTKLAEEVFGGIILGRQTPAMQITEREEEREKRIIAMLIQGETLMHLDNLPTFIDSPSLSSLITAHTFGGRLLGFSRNVKLPNNLTLVGSGNNVQASGEVAKRIVPIMLQPATAHPEARRDFQHPDLRAYVRSQRKAVLSCLLGLVENWLAAGRPMHEDRLGGFESWSGAVGGILQVNGLKAWRGNERAWQAQADPRGSELAAFVEAWHEAFGQAQVSPKELRALAEQHEMFNYVFARRTPQAVSVAFGRLLQRYTDTPVGEWFIRRGGAESHALYHLEAIL